MTTEAKPNLRGYAAVFNSETVIAGLFREVIKPGAFTAAIGRDDVRALFNHDPNFVLGRTKVGTLRLSQDSTGLRYDVTPPSTTWAKDLAVSVNRGDVSQSSFAFRVMAESWAEGRGDDSLPTRAILEAELFDVSPVTYAAYPTTTVTVASAQYDGVEVRGVAAAVRSLADLHSLRMLPLVLRLPCEGCGGRSVALVGTRTGRKMVQQGLCELCATGWELRLRRSWATCGASQDRRRRLALRERERHI